MIRACGSPGITGVAPFLFEPAPDRTRLLAHLDEFARRMKLSGSPGELESFRYLQARLDEYGFRTRLLSHEAYISLPGTPG